MESILPALVSALPQLGVAGIPLIFLIVVHRAWVTDRADYRAALADEAKRHADEVSRVNSAHDAELAELRADIQKMRKQIDDLQAALDLEREARRKAEDMAAEALRRRGRAT